MTEQDHYYLYEEINKVLYSRTASGEELSAAQNYFVLAFESAVFGTDFLECYSELVNGNPDITVRNLHAFCLGHGLGLRMGDAEHIEISKETH